MSFASSLPPPSTFYLFATGLATGIAASLPFVPVARIGRRFPVLMSLVAVVFIGLAVVDRGLDTGWFHLAAGGALILYNIALPRQPGADRVPRQAAEEASPSPLGQAFAACMLYLAVILGVAGLLSDALALGSVPGWELPPPYLVAANLLTAALLLGAAVTSMVLGHWYLVARGLSFQALERLTRLLALALGARLVAALAGTWLQLPLWTEKVHSAGAAAFFAGDGIFILARVLFGFLAPLVLVKMVWNCVRIESNQSATGILYVTVAFILIGEIIAKHFLSAAGLVL
jgi:hypothetical protein